MVMTPRARVGFAIGLITVTIVVASVGILATAFYVPPVPSVAAIPHLAPWDSLLTVCALVAAIVSGGIVISLPRMSWHLRVLAGATLVLLVPGLLFYQRYSVLGVMLLGGDRHWVERAAHEQRDDHAILYLQRVLGVSAYGVDIAERAVLQLEDRAEQSRLFVLLARLVPWPNWQERYQRRALEAAAEPGG